MVTATQTLIDSEELAFAVPGGADIIYSRGHFTSDRAWERLCLGYMLRDTDFKDLNMWKRYWYLAYRLTEGCVVVGGAEGNGKSLWMYYTGYYMRELFGRDSTYDVSPKETYGLYRNIDDENFCEELEKFKDIALIEKEVERGDLPQERLNEALADVKLYNAVIGIDEAYDKLERARRGNFAVNMGRLIRKYRHFHILVILVSPDIDDIDKRMAFKRRTHEVHCYYNEVTRKCRYNIWRRRQNVWTGQELTPERWSFLWESENIIGTSVLPIRKAG